jgi:hypothetical protein
VGWRTASARYLRQIGNYSAMKLNKFLTSFSLSGRNDIYSERYKEVGLLALSKIPEVSNLFEQFSGAIFEDGLFKIHNIGSFYLWTELTFEYFKKFKGKSYCFAFDWVGRQYAVNYSENKSRILMLDPATAEAFELQTDIESFFNEDLIESKGDLFEVDNFIYLKKKIFNQLKFEECLGFQQFLFLGGKVELDNYELIDMEVYWELNYQVFCKTQGLPPGTLVNLSLK